MGLYEQKIYTNNKQKNKSLKIYKYVVNINWSISFNIDYLLFPK